MSESNIPIVKPKTNAPDPLAAQLRENYEKANPTTTAAIVTGQSVKTNYPSELIDLPSRGHFYSDDSPLASGQVELKYMTAREEDILTSQNLIKKGVVLDRLLEALIVTPGVKLEDILVSDKNAIFIAARRLAYGDEYNVHPTCTECDTESEVAVNLNDLKFKEFDFTQYPKGQNTFEFTLPTSKKVVVYKLLTGKEEVNIDAEIKALEKTRGSSNGKGAEVTTRLKYLIQSVDGNTDRSFIKKFVDDMLAKDALALRQNIKSVTPDLNMKFNFICPACGHQEEIAIPLGINFFWPDTTA